MLSERNDTKKSIPKERRLLRLLTCVLISGAALAVAQEPNATGSFKQEELEQMLAPIALYPDSLLSQIFMASTYPLDVVQAQRWADQNKDLKGDSIAAALEKQSWDPSVKSLVNFPEVLKMMNEKLDWTQKLGDAFLAQQKDVMATVQKLRKKAEEQGNLKTTKEQVVKVEHETIIVESADPQVIYVPTYNPTVVYGTWPYPAYPPYYYYPPGYNPYTPFAFATGVAIGAAWGYAWGNCDWDGGDIDIDIDQNLDFNRNIDRDKFKQQLQDRGRAEQRGKGKWQHNPQNRKGVPYRDQATSRQYNRASTADSVKSREAFRGRAEQGRQELARGGADSLRTRPDTTQPRQPQAGRTPGTRDMSSRGTAETRGMSGRSAADNRGSAFQGMNSGTSAKSFSNRGQTSRQGMSRPSGGRGGGGTRGGGGGGRR